jgi:hypothetical protein
MRIKTLRKQVPVRVFLSVEDLLELAGGLSFDEIHEFVVALDKLCEDWGVTEKLHKHFVEEMKKLPVEEAS